ncbi:MAG TPA: ATP-binding protein [Candidatus Lachnoclostridium stercoravium]|uniref:ATP-binding protein n=1 Tax=Candidatus Lachnoclostridium stercoravium TaxID=2838633 RepID=A0A9D2HH79_9FIRM|nr:ATP-binding protein [Candidatus Lachnoclostridium stercoravium]
MKTEQLIIYRNLKYQDLLDRTAALLAGEGQEDPYACANDLIELAAAYGLEGNLWHCFLALCLANNENAYSTSCEIVGEIEGSLNQLVKHDFAVFKELFDCDIARLDEYTEGKPVWTELKSYKAANGNSRIFNKRIRDRIVELAVSLEKAENEDAFQQMVTEFYREFGVGKFGLNKAFRVVEKGENVEIEPIVNVEHVYLNDLVGYELQKKKLIDNTEAFISGRAANNVLLFGDAGTGKSSSVKAILNEYYDRGLRIIEVYKHQFRTLSDVIEQIKDRNYRFIIYMDDLSFEETELEYKYLKAIIEGGLGRKPENVLIYATSNRRHLVRESFRDKRSLDDDIHNNDTVQEKLSLVARFGVTIYYGAPNKKEFQNIVKVLAEKYHVTMPEEELLAEANKWELSHGGLSGRTASQFITYLLGQVQ